MAPVLRRVLDWHLYRPQLDEARAKAKSSPREDALVRRAKSAFSAANHLLEAPERTGEGLAGAHAAALYLESIYWALLSSRTDLERPEPEALWREARPVVDELDLSSQKADETRRLLAMKMPVFELPELAEAEQEAAAMHLRHVAARAIEVRTKARREVDALLVKRVLKFALTLAVLVAVVFGAIALLPVKRDLAVGKPWTTSSKPYDCDPAAGKCGGAQTKIFFSTKEEQNPWIVYDLGAPTRFSSMTIVNRQDGNNGERGRASPLIVEVSDDAKKYREVIRRNEEFSVWMPRFAKQTARYVRLRVPRKSILHLEAVRVHP
jgi:hypothetical protein